MWGPLYCYDQEVELVGSILSTPPFDFSPPHYCLSSWGYHHCNSLLSLQHLNFVSSLYFLLFSPYPQGSYVAHHHYIPHLPSLWWIFNILHCILFLLWGTCITFFLINRIKSILYLNRCPILCWLMVFLTPLPRLPLFYKTICVFTSITFLIILHLLVCLHLSIIVWICLLCLFALEKLWMIDITLILIMFLDHAILVILRNIVVFDSNSSFHYLFIVLFNTYLNSFRKISQ